jgi:hypothetical protein
MSWTRPSAPERVRRVRSHPGHSPACRDPQADSHRRFVVAKDPAKLALGVGDAFCDGLLYRCYLA